MNPLLNSLQPRTAPAQFLRANPGFYFVREIAEFCAVEESAVISQLGSKSIFESRSYEGEIQFRLKVPGQSIAHQTNAAAKTRNKLSDDEIRQLHRRTVDEKLSVVDLAHKVWERSGFNSAGSCAGSIRQAFRRLDLAVGQPDEGGGES